MRRKYTDKDLVIAISESQNFYQVARKLGLKKGGADAYFAKYAKKLGIDTSHFIEGNLSKYSDADAVRSLQNSLTIRQALKRLGITSDSQSHYDRLKRLAAESQIQLKGWCRPGIASVSDDELCHAVATNKSFAAVLRQLGIRQGGGTQLALRTRIEKLGLDTKHFVGQAHMRERKGVPGKCKWDLAEICVANSKFRCIASLKKRLIVAGMLIEQCAICKLGPLWNNKRLVLRLDHINGVNNDHRIENLRLLCPNCDSQTETYGTRNWVNKQLLMLNGSIPNTEMKIEFVIDSVSQSVPETERFCRNCERKQIFDGHKYCSPECYHASTRGVLNHFSHKVQHPSREQLERDIATMPYLQIGKKYGVSDNAVRKWAKQYDLPTKSQTRKLLKQLLTTYGLVPEA